MSRALRAADREPRIADCAACRGVDAVMRQRVGVSTFRRFDVSTFQRFNASTLQRFNASTFRASYIARRTLRSPRRASHAP
ncbi:hypothetical protein [Burkholderia sp. MSMB617WGS]|uniref:hypothetical protein n=1 Tax=Burkholderia sp. MSMB617WGS TaxID=1637831 RepID=UPI000AF2211A|nr:hypothetical protein [Burkholderia sp. MSMB617WGS]